MKHIFELRMKDQIEERYSQLARTVKQLRKERLKFFSGFSCALTVRIFLSLFDVTV